jgi:hypothetical protein
VVSRLVIRHVDDVPSIEGKAQMHGDRRASARLKFLERGLRTVIYTKYDPDLIIERHGHSSDHVVYLLEGQLRVGDVDCVPGTMVLLEHGATFGPLVAGPDGAVILEFYTGDLTPVPEDPEAFEEFLRERGVVPVPAEVELRSGGDSPGGTG